METPSAFASWTAPAPPARTSFADRWLGLFGVVLLGYAVGGRGFAYLGAPPVFIGEVTLLLGVAALATVGGGRFRGASWALAGLLVAWAAVRAALGVPVWGVVAIRDAMVVLYALTAFLVGGLVLAEPERLRWLVRQFRVVVWGLVLVGWPVLFASRFGDLPRWPWADVEVLQTKSGDILVLLAAATVYLAVGFQKARAWVVGLLVVGVLGTMVTSRGGMLAFLLGVALAVVWGPRSGKYGRFVYAGIAVVLVGLAVGSSGIEIAGGSRDLSVDQLVENVLSVTGRSENSSLEGTAQWRLGWWTKIVGYTVGGDLFLTGRGFGVNLANTDGYQVYADESLRSPHNATMTVLARGGVPMLVAWLALQLAWFVRVWRAVGEARRAGWAGWLGFYAVCGTVWIAAHVNASFDVYMEGPMGGIWFWAVFGLALAGTQLQRANPHLLDDLRVAAPPSAQAEPAWDWGAPPPEAPPSPPAPAAPALPTWGPVHRV